MTINKSKLILASAYASILTIVFVVVITIWAELAAPLKDWLKNFSGHHWVSKSIFSLLVYIIFTKIFYFTLNEPSENKIRQLLIWLLITTAIGVVTLTAFYTGHHFQLF